MSPFVRPINTWVDTDFILENQSKTGLIDMRIYTYALIHICKCKMCWAKVCEVLTEQNTFLNDTHSIFDIHFRDTS